MILDDNAGRGTVEGLPLSAAQERMWLYEQVQPGTAVNNISLQICLSGPLDLDVLDRSLREIVARHDALRTAFPADSGRPLQVVHLAAPGRLEVADLAGVPPGERASALARAAADEARRPFDLLRPPLIRFRLFKLAEHEHALVVTTHHMVCDGWSLTLMQRELVLLYGDFAAGRRPSLRPVPVQFARLVQREREQANTAAAGAHLAYWVRQLQGAPPATGFPVDRARKAGALRPSGSASRMLPPELRQRLLDLGRDENATLFMVLLSALDALVHRCTGQEDLVIGAPVAGRTAESRRTVGCLVNLLAIRATVTSGLTFRETLARVRQACLEAFAHQDAPFDAVLERAGAGADAGPMFQVLFNLLNLPLQHASRVCLGDGEAAVTMRFEELLAPEARFDLNFYVTDQQRQLEVRAVYNADLFDRSSVEALLDRYARLLDAVSRDADTPIGRIAVGEPPLAVVESPVPPPADFVEFPIEAIEQSLTARFAAQVRQHPDRSAVVSPRLHWTYRELDAAATRVACAVASATGAGPGAVALLCRHDVPMIAAMLGALKAGKAYVPLSPADPRERLLQIAGDAGVGAVIADRASRAEAEEYFGAACAICEVDETALRPGGTSAPNAADPGSLAYVLYTSGSTGRPKGVMQNHRNVLHFTRAYTNNLRISPSDKLLLVASYGFDAAVMDIYGALLNGASLVIKDVRTDGLAGLSEWMAGCGVTIYHSTPTLFRHAFAGPIERSDVAGVRLVVMGGEEVQGADFDRFKEVFPSTAWFVNGLGPTESTVTLQHFLPATGELRRVAVPVGRPVEGTEVVLLDGDGQPTEILGEIGIRSPHVALGYWNQPELTARAFRSGERGREYRSGDLARRLGDGTLEFAGRRDDQVKVRGAGVLPAEVEQVLASHPDVAEAAVVARRDGSGETVLLAFVVTRDARPADPAKLRGFLHAHLPGHMVPSAIVGLPALPLTGSGKIDRAALPDFGSLGLPDADRDLAPPEGAVEERLAGLWSGLLGVHPVGRHDDFFALGGHSLSATRLVSRIREEFGAELPLRTVFDRPTLAALAAAIGPGPAGGPGCAGAFSPAQGDEDLIEIEF